MGQIHSDCGPLSLLIAEIYLMEQDFYLETFKYDAESIRLLRLHHRDIIQKKKYVDGRVSLKYNVPMTSTPIARRKRPAIPLFTRAKKLFKFN